MIRPLSLVFLPISLALAGPESSQVRLPLGPPASADATPAPTPAIPPAQDGTTPAAPATATHAPQSATGEVTVKSADNPLPAQRPIFKVSGGDAWAVASALGYKFTPSGASGSRDGRNTIAQMHPGVTTSLIKGPRMYQMRTPPTWSVASRNSFHMFCDNAGRPAPLAPGWQVGDLQISGENWRWLTKPQTGSQSPYFSIEITGGQGNGAYSAAALSQIVLVGPPGAKDWRLAFMAGR